MADILVYVSCKFEMYLNEIAQVIGENVPIAFLYVLSIYVSFGGGGWAAVFLLSVTRNIVVSVQRRFILLLILRIGCVILL